MKRPFNSNPRQPQKVLVVDDEPSIVRSLTKLVAALGYIVEGATSGAEALSIINSGRPDLVLIDRRLPDMDGLRILSSIRSSGVSVPVIVVSAIDEVAERARALELGADDYIVKPFDTEELRQRVRAVMRRCYPGSLVLGAAEWTLVPEAQTVRIGRRHIRLGELHYEIVRVLWEAKGEPVSRNQLLLAAWKKRGDTKSNCVAMEISRLRETLGADGDLIEWVRDSGYRLPRRHQCRGG